MYLQNASGSAQDSPETARAMLLKLHAKWRSVANDHRVAEVVEGDDESIEISPLVSYSGEDLENL